jgi:hypothetical protein
MMSGKQVDSHPQDAPDDQRRDEGLVALMKMKPKRHEDMKLGKPRNRGPGKELPDKKPGQ